MNPDWDLLCRRHANSLAVSLPVVPWEEFEAAARELVAADTDLRDALAEVGAIQESLDRSAEQGPAWLAWAPEAVQELFALTASDRLPRPVHQDDLRFCLTDGLARRNPLAHMAGRARKLRATAARLRRALAALRPRLAALGE